MTFLNVVGGSSPARATETGRRLARRPSRPHSRPLGENRQLLLAELGVDDFLGGGAGVSVGHRTGRGLLTSRGRLGVTDVHTHQLETKEQIKQRIHKALSMIALENVYVSPDCGLKTRSVQEAKDKMRVMVEATKEAREELPAKKK